MKHDSSPCLPLPSHPKKKVGLLVAPFFLDTLGPPKKPPGKTNNEVCNGSFAPLRGGSTFVGLRAEVDEGPEGAPAMKKGALFWVVYIG